LPQNAVALPFSHKLVPHNVHTLPLASTIRVARGIVVPEGEAPLEPPEDELLDELDELDELELDELELDELELDELELDDELLEFAITLSVTVSVCAGIDTEPPDAVTVCAGIVSVPVIVCASAALARKAANNIVRYFICYPSSSCEKPPQQRADQHCDAALARTMHEG
jgi:hypothetical protein